MPGRNKKSKQNKGRNHSGKLKPKAKAKQISAKKKMKSSRRILTRNEAKALRAQKSSYLKLTNVKQPKKKQNKRLKPVKAVRPQPDKIAPERKSEEATISFGLVEQEIQAILNTHYQPKTTEKKIEASITKELAKVLPATEALSQKKDHGHVEMVVKSTNQHGHHSPYVLDLTAMIEKKKATAAKKDRLRNFFSTSRETLTATKEHLLFSNNEKNRVVIAEKIEEVVIKQTEVQEPEEVEDEDQPISINIKKHRQFTKTPWFYNLNLPINWQRSLAVYAVICLAIVLPIKVFGNYVNLKKTENQVTTYAKSAYEDIKIASQALADKDFAKAEDSFYKANGSLIQAGESLDEIGLTLKNLIKLVPKTGETLTEAEYLLEIGQDVTAIGAELSPIFAELATSEAFLTDKISTMQSKLNELMPKLVRVDNTLNKIRVEALPADKQAGFLKIREHFFVLLSDAQELNSLAKTLNEILGKDYTKRYLFAFQNNNELRPTGGFLGSLALVDIDRGQIKKMEIPGGGSYALQGQLLENIKAPQPLQLVNARWEMQDANWFPDFELSAQKIAWFYEKSGGSTVDGVIAINASLIPRLLAIVGPVDMPEYGLSLNATNFMEETQREVELDYDKKENAPKQILSDLAPKLLTKLFSGRAEDLLKIAGAFQQGLDEKEIQMYFFNAGVQEKVLAYDWAGKIKDTSKDYLAVINANIRGYKTDNFVEQKIDLASEINAEGEIINNLTITRKHTGNKSDLFGGRSNIIFSRIYVPQGSQLLKAQGFSKIPASSFEAGSENGLEDEQLREIQGEILVDPTSETQVNQELGKTVFGNWIQTDPGETSTVTISYKLPFRFNLTQPGFWQGLWNKNQNENFHSLYLQKQSGTQKTEYQVTIKTPSGLKLDWKHPETATTSQEGISFHDATQADQLIAFTANQ